jgi:hypothetical protein
MGHFVLLDTWHHTACYIDFTNFVAFRTHSEPFFAGHSARGHHRIIHFYLHAKS